MKNENDSQQGTVAIAYLKSTEKRILTELVQEADYSKQSVDEAMITRKFEKERQKINQDATPPDIKEAMLNLLNVIEERLKQNI